MMKRILAALFLCMVVSLPAFAGSVGWVDMKYLGHGAASHKKVSLYADSDGVYNPDDTSTYEVRYNGNVIAGYYKHDIRDYGGAGVLVDNPLYSFCIDLAQNPNKNNYAIFDIVPLTEAPNPSFIGAPMTTAKANTLRELWGRHYSKGLSGQQAAEMQLATWEIIFETSGIYDIGTGSVMSNSYNSGTNALLGSLDGTGPKARLMALTNPRYQDMVAVVPIPAPGALLLGSVGTALVGWIRRRRSL